MESMLKLRRTRVLQFVSSTFVLASLLAPVESHAFEPSSHEDITESELTSMGFDENSADEVGDSSYWTDAFESTNPAAHVDNNRLDLGSTRLNSKKTSVIKALKQCRRRNALDELGAALHTVQDVYAHSNAIDNGLSVDLFKMQRGTAWCDPSANFAPGGLVSGYFSTFGWLTGNQCRYVRPGQCCHYDLNKDKDSAPNGARFPAAYAAAQDATRDYVQAVIDDLHTDVGGDQATFLENMLKERQRSLSFVIDDTGSMSSDIAGVRSAALGILDSMVAGGEAPSLNLVTFKDSATDYGMFCDIDEFRSAISGLYASGGGDCPEASNSGLLESLGNFPLISTDMQMRGGRIVLATDASAGDYMLGPLVAAQAAMRGVSIDAILTGDCYAEESVSSVSGLRTLSSTFVPSDNNDPMTSKLSAVSLASTPGIMSSYDPLSSRSARTQLKALTAQTGGVLFNVSRVEVDDVVPTLLELSSPDTAVIRSWKISSDMGAAGEIEIPVDDSFGSQVSFMITASTAAALPAFTLIDPDGNTVDTTSADVTRLLLSSVDKYTISNPATGIWRMHFDNPGDYIVRAFGESALHTADIRFYDPSVKPLTPDLDIMPMEGQPASGKELGVELAMTSAAGSIESMVLRLEDGTTLLSFTPTEVRTGHYRVSFIPPAEPFFIELAGQTTGGVTYLRQTLVPVYPQSVAMRVEPKMATAQVGTAVEIAVTVSNTGDSDATYSLTATSDAFWDMNYPATVDVAAGESTTVSLLVTVPVDAMEGIATNVVLLAQDSANALVRNNASVQVIAKVNQAPVCSAAQASESVLWPPKHKMVTESILNVTDDDGDEIAITITSITQDEPVTRRKGRHTAPDGTGVGTSEAAVRSERSAHGDGRIYAIHFDADDGNGGSCSGTVNVSVPHDHHHPAIDSGQDYDSTQDK